MSKAVSRIPQFSQQSSEKRTSSMEEQFQEVNRKGDCVNLGEVKYNIDDVSVSSPECDQQGWFDNHEIANEFVHDEQNTSGHEFKYPHSTNGELGGFNQTNSEDITINKVEDIDSGLDTCSTSGEDLHVDIIDHGKRNMTENDNGQVRPSVRSPSKLPVTPTSNQPKRSSLPKSSAIPTFGSFSPKTFMDKMQTEKRNSLHVKSVSLDNGCGVARGEVKPPTTPGIPGHRPTRANSTTRAPPSNRASSSTRAPMKPELSMLQRAHKPHYCTHNHEQLAGAATRSNMTRSASVSSLNQTKTSTRSGLNSNFNPNATTSTINSVPLKQVTSTIPASKPVKSKRPAWDLKGRLQDMEQSIARRDHVSHGLQSQLENNNERIVFLESQNSQLSGTVAQKEQQTTEISQEIGQLKKKLRDTEDELDSVRRKYQREMEECQRESEEKQDSMRRKFEREIEDLKFRISSLQRQKDSLESELNASQQENSGLKSTVAQLTSSQAGLNAELDSTKLQLDQELKAGKLKDAQISELKRTIAEHEQSLEEASQKMREHETTRRKLHNTIQELKGNIRVFCRVRPLLGDERLANDGLINHMNFPDPDERVIELDKLADVNPNESIAQTSMRRGTNKYEFSFDKVFQPTSSQSVVFEEISQLVQSALDGYNVCIFAYGQTGSGKTYTMEGPNDVTEDTMGMIPRAVDQIFQSARELEEKGWQYAFVASFLEIYNESIRDLLGNGKSDVKHEVKMVSGSSDVMVSDLTLVPVKSEKQVEHLLKKASENRAVAETKCNERSSRSHSVFQLKISGNNSLTGETCQGLLSLVDLAGSERLKDSGSEGKRLKEAQCINKSLSDLGNVIMALGNKENFVPYRNSRLTYLLQNSLGGNSKTLMFVNVSPKEECFQETLCSLRFAMKVNQCNIGTAQKKTK